MQTHWIKQDKNPDLILLVLGWGCDHHAVEHICPPKCDVLCTYNYLSLEPITPEITAHYRHVYLFAWSFGVWVAEQITKDISLHKAVALNGTPFPVDNHYGIPVRSIAVTLKGLLKLGIGEFNNRTYGDFYNNIAPYLESRPFEDKYDELCRLSEWATQPYTPTIKWAKAIVGNQDIIFPPSNTCAYWGPLAELKNLPHYPFADPEIVTQFLDVE